MFAKSAILLGLVAMSATLSSAYKLPSNVDDGVYTAVVSSDGSVSLTPLEDTSAATTKNRRSTGEHLFKRATTWCGCQFGMDHGDTDSANAAIQKTVGSGKTVPGGGSIVSVKGSAVAFFCNFDSIATSASSTDGVAGAQLITNACGRYIAGTVRLDGHSHLDFGYLNGFGGDVCGAAEGSGAHSC